MKNHPFLEAFLFALLIVLQHIIFYFILFFLPQLWGFKLSGVYLPSVYLVTALSYIPWLYYLRKRWKINIKYSSFRPLSWVKCLFFLILTIAFYLLNQLLFWPIEPYNLLFRKAILSIELCLAYFNPAMFLNCLLAVFVGPLLEEFLYRGLIFTFLLRKYSFPKALIFSSLLFAFGHLRYEDFFSLFIYGCLYAYVFYKTQSLSLSALVHGVSNLLNYIIKSEPVSIYQLENTQIYIAIVSAAVFICMFYVLIHWERYFKTAALMSEDREEQENSND